MIHPQSRSEIKSNLLPFINGFYIILALVSRAIKLNFITNDTYAYVLPWYNYLKEQGLSRAYSSELFNYTPPYLYLLDFSTLFKSIPSLWAIKIISIIFDFLAAVAVYKIVSLKYKTGIKSWLGFFLTLFAPIVFIQSSIWGQCDIIYTTFLLWSLYFLLKKKYAYGVLTFSIAFSFKLQAIFFAPLLVLFILKKKINPLWIFTPIVVYFLAITPAWIAGNSVLSLFTIYLNQFGTYKLLTMNAPNLYAFIPQYEAFQIVVVVGIVVTLIVILIYIIFRWKLSPSMEDDFIVFDALFFTFVIPFLLPKMHERYFFSAGIFIIILAIFNRKFIFPAITLHISSALSYLPFLFGYSYRYVQIAAIINSILLFYLLVLMGNVYITRKTDSCIVNPIERETLTERVIQ